MCVVVSLLFPLLPLTQHEVGSRPPHTYTDEHTALAVSPHRKGTLKGPELY